MQRLQNVQGFSVCWRAVRGFIGLRFFRVVSFSCLYKLLKNSQACFYFYLLGSSGFYMIVPQITPKQESSGPLGSGFCTKPCSREFFYSAFEYGISCYNRLQPTIIPLCYIFLKSKVASIMSIPSVQASPAQSPH